MRGRRRAARAADEVVAGRAHVEGTGLSFRMSNQSRKACSSACSVASVASMVRCSSSVKLTCVDARSQLQEQAGQRGRPPHRASGFGVHHLIPKYFLLREGDFEIVLSQIGAVGGRGGSEGHTRNPVFSWRFQFFQSDPCAPGFQIITIYQRLVL